MKNILILIIGIFLSSCKLQAQSALTVDEFQSKLASAKDGQLVDVRTPEEYTNGHLKQAQNIDYRNPEFREKIKALDKKKPVFVYCLAGSRSASAAEILRSSGFTQVYDMKGGYAKWTATGKPVADTGKAEATGMSMTAYKNMLGSAGVVLVDFNAPWCAPCVKMLPTLKKLATEYKSKARIETVSYDENKSLVKELGISEIPAFLLYKDGKLVTRKNGYMEEAEFRKLLDSAL